MLSEGEIHQRDLSNIIRQLHEDVEALKHKYEGQPGERNKLEDEINILIKNAENDLRLKTHAIVRSRMSKSSLLPMVVTKTKNHPLPPLPAQDRTRPIPSSTLQMHPIAPIAPPVKRTVTQKTQHRQRIFSREKRETKISREEEVKSTLKEMVKIAPIDRDPFPHSVPPQPLFVMDENPPEQLSLIPEPFEQLSGKLSEEKEPEPYPRESTDEKPYQLLFVMGQPQENQAYMNFIRDFANYTEKVSIIFQMLRRFLEENRAKEVIVDGTKFDEILELELDEITDQKMSEIIVNFTRKPRKMVSKTGFGFTGQNVENRAAMIIQSLWRGFFTRRQNRERKKQSNAARFLQNWYRTNVLSKRFREEVYNNLESQTTFVRKFNKSFQLSYPVVYLHLIDYVRPTIFGRLSLLSSEESLILYTKKPLPDIIPPEIADRCLLLSSSQQINSSLDDVLPSDKRAIEKILEFSTGKKLVTIPNKPGPSIPALSLALSSFVMAPLPSHIQTLMNTSAIQEITLRTSSLISGTTQLANSIASFCLSDLDAPTILIKTRDDLLGWVSTRDLPLLQRLRANRSALTKEELEDPSLHSLLSDHILRDISCLVNLTRKFSSVNNFVGYAKLLPLTPISAPVVAIQGLPGKPTEIVGTWETLYVSAFEPFASIHPAFTSTDALLEKAGQICEDFTKQDNIGYSTLYFYNCGELYLDDVRIGESRKLESLWLSERKVGAKYDKHNGFNGKYVYVQERLNLPFPLNIDELDAKLLTDIEIIPDPRDPTIIAIVAMADSPYNVVKKAYDCLCALSDATGGIEEVLIYIRAIEYVMEQIEIGASTFYSRKTKIKGLVSSRLPTADPFVGRRRPQTSGNQHEDLLQSTDTRPQTENRDREITEEEYENVNN